MLSPLYKILFDFSFQYKYERFQKKKFSHIKKSSKSKELFLMIT